MAVLFQPPEESDGDIFWDEDYERGNHNTWLRKKYTGPYVYRGTMEHPEEAKRLINEMIDRHPLVDVLESFKDFFARKKQDEKAQIRILRKAPLIDLTIEEMISSIGIEHDIYSLLERLEVDKL